MDAKAKASIFERRREVSWKSLRRCDGVERRGEGERRDNLQRRQRWLRIIMTWRFSRFEKRVLDVPGEKKLCWSYKS